MRPRPRLTEKESVARPAPPPRFKVGLDVDEVPRRADIAAANRVRDRRADIQVAH
jgi:hypothetical protein